METVAWSAPLCSNYGRIVDGIPLHSYGCCCFGLTGMSMNRSCDVHDTPNSLKVYELEGLASYYLQCELV